MLPLLREEVRAYRDEVIARADGDHDRVRLQVFGSFFVAWDFRFFFFSRVLARKMRTKNKFWISLRWPENTSSVSEFQVHTCSERGVRLSEAAISPPLLTTPMANITVWMVGKASFRTSRKASIFSEGIKNSISQTQSAIIITKVRNTDRRLFISHTPSTSRMVRDVCEMKRRPVSCTPFQTEIVKMQTVVQ